MRKARHIDAVPSLVNVKEVEPHLLPSAAAARFLGKSASWLAAFRTLDRERIREGLLPLGPPWVVFRGGIAYRLDHLRSWIDAQAVVRGDVSFRGDKP